MKYTFEKLLKDTPLIKWFLLRVAGDNNCKWIEMKITSEYICGSYYVYYCALDMHDLVDWYINYLFRIKVRINDLVNGREISV